MKGHLCAAYPRGVVSFFSPGDGVRVRDVEQIDVRVLDQETVRISVVEVDHVDALDQSCIERNPRSAAYVRWSSGGHFTSELRLARIHLYMLLELVCLLEIWKYSTNAQILKCSGTPVLFPNSMYACGKANVVTYTRMDGPATSKQVALGLASKSETHGSKFDEMSKLFASHVKRFRCHRWSQS